MSPLRWEVLGLAFVLALPVLAMALRGDLTLDETMARLPWCLGAAWAAVALLTAVTRPRPAAKQPSQRTEPAPLPESEPESTPTP